MLRSMNIMIVGALMVVAVLAMGLTVFITLHKFNAAFIESVNERFYFAMEEVRDVVEGEIRLGQSLDHLSNAQSALEHLMTIDPYVISAEIFDQNGRTVYSTDNSYLFDVVPEQWEDVWRGSKALHWSVDGSDPFVLGVGLLDQFNEPAGSIVLLYDTDIQTEALLETRQDLERLALWIGGALVLCLSLSVVILTGPLKKRLSEIERDLVSQQENVAGSKDFISSYRKSLSYLDQVDEELKKLDEAAFK